MQGLRKNNGFSDLAHGLFWTSQFSFCFCSLHLYFTSTLLHLLSAKSTCCKLVMVASKLFLQLVLRSYQCRLDQVLCSGPNPKPERRNCTALFFRISNILCSTLDSFRLAICLFPEKLIKIALPKVLHRDPDAFRILSWSENLAVHSLDSSAIRNRLFQKRSKNLR